jgi:IS5 family transposase
VIETRRLQCSFAAGFLAEETRDLWDPWMRQAGQVLNGETLLVTVYEALGKRHPNSRTRGRLGTPAEIVLRLMSLKHIRNWSYAVAEREVRANLVYRDFTRVGGGIVPDATTMGRWGGFGPEVVQDLHARVVAIGTSDICDYLAAFEFFPVASLSRRQFPTDVLYRPAAGQQNR